MKKSKNIHRVNEIIADMNCKDVQARLIDWLDQALDAEAAATIGTHLGTCQQCRNEAEELREMLQAMHTASFEQPGPELREQFASMLQSELNILAAADIVHIPPSATPMIENQPFTAGNQSPAIDGYTRQASQHPDTRHMVATKPVTRFMHSAFARVAAALILLLGGVWIGTQLKSRPAPSGNGQDQLSSLRKEVKEMKEVLLFSLINDESASQRIKAVSYAEEMSNPDQQVIDALVSTLNNDKNVNVRLAALYSLARFSDNRGIRDSLVKSLPAQKEPIIQVALISLLTEKKETRAIAPIQKIESDKKTLQEVREVARKGLRTL